MAEDDHAEVPTVRVFIEGQEIGADVLRAWREAPMSAAGIAANVATAELAAMIRKIRAGDGRMTVVSETPEPTLPEWLLACIAGDEADLRELLNATSGQSAPWVDTVLGLIGWLLTECETKRRVVEYAIEHPLPGPPGDSKFDTAQAVTLAVVTRYLGVPYADRPGYRDEWRP